MATKCKLTTKLWRVVQFTEQWSKKLTYNTDNYNAYNGATTWKCDHLSSAELKAFNNIIHIFQPQKQLQPLRKSVIP